MRVFRWICLFSLICSVSAWGQTLRPDQLMVLVVGASASQPDPDQQAVVARLQQLRQDPAWRNLQMGTMHFDRPREAAHAQNTLGVRREDLPALVLAQIDDQQTPVRKLYAIPRVTRNTLDQVDAMAQQWSFRSGSSGASNGGMPPNNFPPAHTPPVTPPPQGGRNTYQMANGSSLGINNALSTPDRKFSLGLQPDGNLVLHRTDRQPYLPLWSSDTAGKGATSVTLGSDGILRMTDNRGNVVWQSHQNGNYGRYVFQIQQDGNAVIYRQDSVGTDPVWNTGTHSF